MIKYLLAPFIVFTVLSAATFGKPSDEHFKTLTNRYDYVGYVAKTTNPKWNKTKSSLMSWIDNDRAPDGGDILVGIISLGNEGDAFECHIYVKKFFGYEILRATVGRDDIQTINGKTVLSALGASDGDNDGFEYKFVVAGPGHGYDWSNRRGRGY